MTAIVDLRSDTVTRPTAAMRRAMAEAEVGDDQFGEDPSVNARLGEGAPDAATVVARARDRGVLVMAFAPRTIRAVTHLDVTTADCQAAAAALGGACRH